MRLYMGRPRGDISNRPPRSFCVCHLCLSRKSARQNPRGGGVPSCVLHGVLWGQKRPRRAQKDRSPSLIAGSTSGIASFRQRVNPFVHDFRRVLERRPLRGVERDAFQSRSKLPRVVLVILPNIHLYRY